MNFKLRTSPSRISIALLTLAVLPALALGTGAAVAAPPLPEPSSTAAAEKSDQALPPEIPSPGAKMGWTEDSVVAPQLLKNAPVESGPRGAAAPQAVTGSTSFVPGWGILGLDVSAWQAKVNPNGSRTDNVNWQAEWNQGARFAYVKATEGTSYKSDTFGQQYGSAAAVGMIRGAYHFALPSVSSGTQQANFFAANGGGWSADGITLPPLLDIEYNPYASLGDTCYNMAGTQMVNWIKEFSNRMMTLTGRYPVIYTTTDWWTRCTGNAAGFGNQALHVAAYNSVGPGTLPASWNQYSFWQYSDKGPTAGDSNIWNGDLAALKRFATVPEGQSNTAADQIQRVYAQNSALLGSSTSSVMCGLSNGGCYQAFSNGAIIWSPNTGAQVSKFGPIRTTWGGQGYENGALGYPTSAENCGLKDGGCYQAYENGAIVWSVASGAQVSGFGPVRDSWGVQGFETGPLGYPTNRLTCGLADSGCYQMYQGGAVIWSSKSGAQVSLYGPIRDRWASQGLENGYLKYPTSGQVCGLKDNGCYQMYQGGAILNAASVGAQISKIGAIRGTWSRLGLENGRAGYPAGSEICGLKNNGCYQLFQGGAIIWSPSTGAQFSPFGSIRYTWANLGLENGALGYPTSNEQCSSATQCTQSFEGGTISWTSGIGTNVRFR
ncbi:MAG: hypothetical protein IIZ13_14875 [Renibacterium sp.]|nr:hypothetical protein [Renibacterium sp.]